jgi:hypothetical protein
LKAKLGSNPSYIWRSILASRDLLLKGLQWRVRNGKEVNIWEDDWGPSVLHRRPNSMEVQRVAELIDKDSGSWDLSVFREVFEEESATRVQQVPLSNPQSSDVLI